MSLERRRASRVEILGRLHGHVVSMDVPVTVREISLGGLSFETTVSFPIGAVHEFRLTLGDGSSVHLRGRIVRCEESTAPDDSRIYVTGVQFIDDEPEGPAAVGDLIGKIT